MRVVYKSSIHYFIFAAFIVLMITWGVGPLLAEDADVAVEGSSEQQVIVAGAIDRSNLLLVDLHALLYLQTRIQE